MAIDSLKTLWDPLRTHLWTWATRHNIPIVWNTRQMLRKLLNMQKCHFLKFLCQSVRMVTFGQCAWKVDNVLIWQFQFLFQWATWQICEIWIWILKICLTFLHSINTVLTDIKEGLLNYNRVQVVKRGVKVHSHLFVQSPTSLPAWYHNADQYQSTLVEVWRNWKCCILLQGIEAGKELPQKSFWEESVKGRAKKLFVRTFNTRGLKGGNWILITN